MSKITKILAARGLSSLIVKKINVSAPNNPPVWDTQPSSSDFIQGFPLIINVGGMVSDPDGDSVAITTSLGSAGTYPDGFTWHSASAQLEYDGSLPPFTTSAVAGFYFIADDGTDTTQSDTFTLEAVDASPAASWPRDPSAQAGVNVSGYTKVMQQEPYRTWNSKKDLIFAQHRYPTAAQVSAEVADNNWMRSQNANIKTAYYSFNQACSPNTAAAKHLGYEAMVDNNNALSDWRIYDNATGTALEYSNEVAGTIPANPNFEAAGMPAGSTHANFAIAFWEHTKSKYSDQWPWDGRFYDSMDYQDSFPKWKLESDGTTDGNPDYARPWSSGSTDPALYRNGIIYDVSQMRAIGPSTQIAGSNGGRDGDAVNEDVADNEWAGFWDFRLSENWQDKLGLITVNDSFELEFADPDSRIDIALRAALVSETMVDQTASNRLGKGTVILDFVMDWVASSAPELADLSQDHLEAGRLIQGFSMLHHSFMGAPNLTRGDISYPYLDEVVYDMGSPLTLDGTASATPNIGSVAFNPARVAPEPWYDLTVRAPDQAAVSGNYGWYAQRYDGGSTGNHRLWVGNLNEPTGQSPWPQATEDTYTMPAPQPGKVWRYADSNYVNTERPTGATACENQSPLVNTGLLVGPTVDMRRWTFRLFVEADA